MSDCGDCGHGVCGANASCVCDDLWTGHTDFVTEDLTRWGGRVTGCATSLVGVKLIWAFPLPMMLCVWAYSIVALVDQWQFFRTQQKLNGSRLRWHHSLPVDYLLVMTTLGFPLCFTLAMVKILLPRELFAVTPLATVLLCLVRCTTSIGFGLHITNAARLAFKQHNVSSQELDQQVQCGIGGLWTAIGAAALISLLPVVALGYPPTSVGAHEALFSSFFGLSSFIYFCLCSWCLWMRQGLKRTFDRMVARFAELNSLHPSVMGSMHATGRAKSTRNTSKRAQALGSGRSGLATNSTRSGKQVSDKSCRSTESATGAPSSKKAVDNAYIGRLLSIRDKALHQQTHIVLNTGILSLMYLLFCVVPPLRAQATYLMAFHFNAYNIVGLKIAHLYVRSSRQDVRRWLLPCCPAPITPETELGAAGSGARPGSEARAASERPRSERPRPNSERPRAGSEGRLQYARVEEDGRQEPGSVTARGSYRASPLSRSASSTCRIKAEIIDTDA